MVAFPSRLPLPWTRGKVKKMNNGNAPQGAKDARQDGDEAGSALPGSGAVERKFIEAMCRNDQHKVRSHLYEVFHREPEMTDDGAIIAESCGPDYAPMCGYGWNRSDGESFSILRGHRSARGTCQLCKANVEANKPAVTDGWAHKTKWL